MSEKKRLILGPLPEQQDDYSHYEESVTRWDRIIGVISVFVVLVVGVVYLSIGTNTEQELEEIVATKLVPDLQESIDVNQLDVPAAGKLKLSPDESKDLQTATEVASKSEPVEVDMAPAVVSVASKGTAVVSVASKGTDDALAESNMTENSVKTLSQEAKALQAPLSKSSSNDAPASIEILNSAINEAVLTLELKQGEPGSPLAYDVPMSSEGIIKVILFTEMAGLKGEKLYHEWYRNGVRQARVKIPVNVALQRSYSSKYINSQMLGDWQIKVVNGKSDLFIDAKFRVVAP